jgi:hypothetical protein
MEDTINTKYFWLRNVKGKDVLAVLNVDGKIILKQIYVMGYTALS